MANKFKVISKKFYNQYRNDDGTLTFPNNLGEYTTVLQGNVGEIVKLTEVIKVGTIINENQSTDMTFIDNTTNCYLETDFLNFQSEGLSTDLDVLIEVNGTTATGKVESITGKFKTVLVLNSTARTNLLAAGVVDGDLRDDFVIKVTTVPTWLTYKYGLIDNDATANNYKSPLDSNEQAYYLNGVSSSTQSMTFQGREIGASLGDVTIKFDSTSSSYLHQFTLNHTFKLPYYTADEDINITDLKNPSRLHNRSVKYCNGFFFGGDTSNTVLKYEDLGDKGNVGYFNENFLGRSTKYSTENYVVTNSLGTGKLEATVTNTVTFDLVKTSTFSGGEEIIITHTKLPNETEYSRSKTAFDTNFIFDQVRQTEGAAATSNGIFSNVTVTLGASGELQVSMDITYTSDQKELITDNSKSLIYVTVATEDVGKVNIVDRANVIVKKDQFTKDPDVSGLVLTSQPEIFNHWDFDSGSGWTNMDGWNGDLLGINWDFTTDATQGATIVDFKIKVQAYNGARFFDLYSKNVPINKIIMTKDTYWYQVFKYDEVGNIEMRDDEVLGFIDIDSTVPPSPTTSQSWSAKFGLRVPHREWIENLNVPSAFIDQAEPNDNRNEKTSNYSGVNSYEIYVSLELQIKTASDGLLDGFVLSKESTQYNLISDQCEILDFDDNNGNGFTGDVIILDQNNQVATNISSSLVNTIKVEFTHALGTLSTANLWGRIWIEEENGTNVVGELSTDKDFTYLENALIPSDTLSTGNNQYVEVVSALNKVTLICYTNPDQLSDGVSYNVYARLGDK